MSTYYYQSVTPTCPSALARWFHYPSYGGGQEHVAVCDPGQEWYWHFTLDGARWVQTESIGLFSTTISNLESSRRWQEIPPFSLPVKKKWPGSDGIRVFFDVEM